MKVCPRCAEPYADDAGFCPLDGTQLVRDPDPFVGRTLAARYRLVRKIGSGGMAVVYLARHVMIERLSAIKILRQDLGMNVSHRERFLREARAVNRINHPNIVEITDFGEDGGLVFLVMEYIEGESLQGMLGTLPDGRFEIARAVRAALQIAAALGRAHELGVIHRDLKPENVLLVPRNGADYVKLTDFGIAKIVDAPSITFTEQRFGTPGYIAPEYVDGKPATARGDLYALGVVLYQMVTGQLPYDEKIPIDLIVAALKSPPIKPSARFPGVPEDLEGVILKMIARKPEDRPSDAFAVHDLLEKVLANLGVANPEVSVHGVEDAPPSSVVPSSSSPQSWLASELLGRGVVDGDDRWRSTLSDFERHIQAAERQRGPRDLGVRRARELAEGARELLASLDRITRSVTEYQAEVDGLEAHGRGFRETLGHAIDQLSRDRSREHAHLEAIAALRSGIRDEVSSRRLDTRQRETLVWEGAALDAEEARVRAVEADLAFQVETLQRESDNRNAELETKLAESTGMLEGALSAMRRITGELVRTMADAANCL
ncbi:MAG TPA: protein kinase [Polyangiaceae bacterium]|jgi:serine/threonine-protein kinase|nr:protein kinase [Polyangiaceae bacterium]